MLEAIANESRRMKKSVADFLVDNAMLKGVMGRRVGKRLPYSTGYPAWRLLSGAPPLPRP